MDYDKTVFAMFCGERNYRASLKEFATFSRIDPKDAVLELCCGTGLLTEMLVDKTSKIVGLDRDEQQLENARKRSSLRDVTFLCQGVEDLLGDEIHRGRYSRVVCANGFHYIDPEKFYGVMEHCLAPGGRGAYNVRVTSSTENENFIEEVLTKINLLRVRILQDFQPHADFSNIRIEGGGGYLKPISISDALSVPNNLVVTNKKEYTLFEDPTKLNLFLGYFFEIMQPFFEKVSTKTIPQRFDYISPVGFMSRAQTWRDVFQGGVEDKIRSVSKPRVLKTELFVEVARRG